MAAHQGRSRPALGSIWGGLVGWGGVVGGIQSNIILHLVEHIIACKRTFQGVHGVKSWQYKMHKYVTFGAKIGFEP